MVDVVAEMDGIEVSSRIGLASLWLQMRSARSSRLMGPERAKLPPL